jgi:hypothetical protein
MLRSFFLALLVVGAGLYTLLVSSNSSLSNREDRCDSEFIKSITHWSSACFYTAFFQQKPTEAQLLEEKNRLDQFAERGGLAADVLWYRAKFHQRFQNKFHTPFQDIHEMHLAYTNAQHIRIDLQIDYLAFLHENDLIPLGQQTLNQYCKTYIRPPRKNLIEEIKIRIENRDLPFSTDYCQSILQPGYVH